MATSRKITYGSSSPYMETGIYRLGLDVMTHRPIPRYKEDRLYEIETQYNFRPDLLAADIFDDDRLWWVFSARNPSQLKDPIFDFATGNKIFLPTKQTLVNVLGL